MKIVLIDKEEGLKIGGIIVYSHRLSEFLTSYGHEVSILRFAKKQIRERNIYRLPYYLAEPRSFIFLPSEKTQQIIKSHLIKIKPDIVYTPCGLSPLDFLLPSLCHELNIPVAGVWHADFNNTISSYQILTKTLFLAYLPFVKQLDLFHVFSEKLANFYKERGIMTKRILVLPNGIDEKLYTWGISSFAKKHKIGKGILFLGRLTLQKNPEILIRSFLDLERSDTKLVLVGHGDKEKELRKKYHDRRIIFTGAVTDEKRKLDIIRSCQIFVLPSRFEGMPLAILEAMSSGLACIASDAGSNKELLENAGIVIPSTKLNQQLPMALRICLENPEFVNLLGSKARQKVVSQYSQKMIFSHLLASFEKTIYDYQQRGSPRTKPIDINKEIGKRISIILDKLEDFLTLY